MWPFKKRVKYITYDKLINIAMESKDEIYKSCINEIEEIKKDYENYGSLPIGTDPLIIKTLIPKYLFYKNYEFYVKDFIQKRYFEVLDDENSVEFFKNRIKSHLINRFCFLTDIGAFSELNFC